MLIFVDNKAKIPVGEPGTPKPATSPQGMCNVRYFYFSFLRIAGLRNPEQ